MLPSTLSLAAFEIARVPKPNAAFVIAALWIVPLLSVSALAPMLSPSLSASVACTV